MNQKRARREEMKGDREVRIIEVRIRRVMMKRSLMKITIQASQTGRSKGHLPTVQTPLKRLSFCLARDRSLDG